MFPSVASNRTSRFTGKERDETGLDYFEARYFSSAQGRFLGVDPYNIIVEAESKKHFETYIGQSQNWNRYVYVWNNPLRYVDPHGETVIRSCLHLRE
jgi:RHS repeat-associated protein